MAEEVRHPLFARIYDRLCGSMEQEARPYREELLTGLSGTVIEVGAGNGHNFQYYPSSVSHVLAVEPEGYLRQKAVEAAKGAPVEVKVVDSLSERLPAEPESFDAGVACLVLCTVGNPAASLAELRRVIRPGGELRFLEHVIANSSGLARAQRFSDSTWWPLVAGGCHSARDTGAVIEQAGFEIDSCRRFPFRPSLALLLVTPHILGTARRP